MVRLAHDRAQDALWRFQVRHREAERVYLVRYSAQGLSLWTVMERVRPGVWESRMRMGPGWRRLAWFVSVGGVFFEAGAFDLSASPWSGLGRRVVVDLDPSARASGWRARYDTAHIAFGSADAKFSRRPSALPCRAVACRR